MKRLTSTLVLAALITFAVAPAAHASFGLKELDVTFNNQDGSAALQAGAHPFSLTTTVGFNSKPDPEVGFEVPDDEVKDLVASQMEGLVGNPTVVPRCTNAAFLSGTQGECPATAQIGVNEVEYGEPGGVGTFPVYSLNPPPGAAMKIGFHVLFVPVTATLGVSESAPYNVIASFNNISNVEAIYHSKLTLWGVPAAKAHDHERIGPGCSGGCSVNLAETPFLTTPRACGAPLATSFKADSWQNPGAFLEEGVKTHDGSEPPNPQGMIGCGKLGFGPTITAQPTTKAASSPTGLDFSLDVEDEGLENPSTEATSQADIAKAEVTLPEGFSTNPSLAEGLNVCTVQQLHAETAFSAPGAGCPDESKIGTVEVETPLLNESVDGSLFVAKPYENEAGNSLLGLYMVIKNANLGIKVVQPLKVEPDPVTGRLTTVAENLPQLPFSHFRLHFREGTRSPLASPPGCGTYSAHALLTPSSGGAPVSADSAFQIIVGPESGPCPSGGLPPFHPGLEAGTLNNAAGHFSPFNLRLTRKDSEQEITHFSIKLPPGIVGKLAGIPYCSDAAIAAAKARTGPHGGQEEIERPSCPAASEVGRTLVGAGVGPSLAYAPGKVYLAGPYHGSNLSIAAITAAKVGPFDLGTVVVRDALKIDPETAEVFIDAAGSDPIPHIIQGIPVHLRDIRAYVDRSNFVLNPTDCSRTSTASTVLGSGLDFGSEADDRPITLSTPFQAADCAALPFKPKLGLSLKGGTKRGDYPAFKATLQMNGIGEAGIAKAQVTLPKSEFIANAHFNTICTRVQFKEGAGNGANCPSGSIYGKARATTPILGEPLEGPVFLRSTGTAANAHVLPDLVVALHNAQVDFDLVGHVDSVKGKLRNTFEAAPDAPVTSFVLEMQGGKKGLFENSTDLCASVHKAESNFTGQNGKVWDTKPVMKVKCGANARKKGKHNKRAAHKRRAAR